MKLNLQDYVSNRTALHLSVEDLMEIRSALFIAMSKAEKDLNNIYFNESFYDSVDDYHYAINASSRKLSRINKVFTRVDDCLTCAWHYRCLLSVDLKSWK